MLNHPIAPKQLSPSAPQTHKILASLVAVHLYCCQPAGQITESLAGLPQCQMLGVYARSSRTLTAPNQTPKPHNKREAPNPNLKGGGDRCWLRWPRIRLLDGFMLMVEGLGRKVHNEAVTITLASCLPSKLGHCQGLDVIQEVESQHVYPHMLSLSSRTSSTANLRTL